jgi:uncharacterized membrane protein YcaP (DUF421 family)
MDFFHGQESLTAMQWILRAIIAFFFLLIAAKIMGQRSIAQLRLLDFIMAILLGNIIAHPLSDEGLGLQGSMITMSVLVVLYMAGVFLSLKLVSVRNWLVPRPYPLVQNGQILYKNLAKARISIDELLAELRKGQIEDVQKILIALWEADGTISYFLNPQNQMITPADIQLKTKSFVFPYAVIKEGKVDSIELDQIGRDEMWLKNRIKISYNADVRDILLATIDHNDNMKIHFYN